MWHRNPTVAGSFYPSDASELRKLTEQYISNASSLKINGDILGLISPHAGYIYSGPVAGFCYSRLNSETELVVVLAPSHRARFNGASVITEGIYETPLGEVEIDSLIGQELVKSNYFEFIKEAHQFEHSLEVQVPFLQTALCKFKIVPIVIGTTDLSICSELAKSISHLLKKEERKFSIVISTDLSHYHSYNEAKKMDNIFIENLKLFDENKLKDVLESKKAEACGEGPLLTGIMICKELGAGSIEILKYANSGDTAGPKDQVVGYVSAVFVK